MFHTTLLVAATLFASPANRPDGGKAPSKADEFKTKDLGDLSGYYTCVGKEGPGKTYTGVAVITKKNDVYVIQWIIGLGAGFIGVGIRDGDTLACSWAIGDSKGMVVRGINLYRIESGPRLIGRWTSFPGDGSIRTETLTFLKRLGDE